MHWLKFDFCFMVLLYNFFNYLRECGIWLKKMHKCVFTAWLEFDYPCFHFLFLSIIFGFLPFVFFFSFFHFTFSNLTTCSLLKYTFVYFCVLLYKKLFVTVVSLFDFVGNNCCSFYWVIIYFISIIFYWKLIALS